MAVLSGNDEFSVLVLSLKNGTPDFWKRFSFSRKSGSKLKYWKRSKFHWLSHKNMPISQTEGYLENPLYRFLEERMLFLLALKLNLYEKAFSSVTTKTNSNFAVKLPERRNHSFLLSVWWITYFKLHNGMYRT